MTVRLCGRSRFGRVAVTTAVIVMSPAVLVAGELMNRHYRRERYPWPGPGRPPARRRRLPLPAWWFPELRCRMANHAWRGRPRPVLWALLTNPVWIALTAPARWVLDHLRPRVGGRRRGNGNGGPGAGVREPRRPLPDPSAGAIALPGPRFPG